MPEEVVHRLGLTRGLKRLHQLIQKHDSDAHVLYDPQTINNIYNVRSTTGFIIRNTLFLQSNIAIMVPHTRLHFFKATAYPVPIQHPGGFTKIILKKPYIAATDDNRYFTELDLWDIKLCEEHRQQCPSVTTLMTSDKTTCLSSLLYNHSTKDITNACNPRAYPGTPPELIIRLNNTSTLLQTHQKGYQSKSPNVKTSQCQNVP